MVERGEREADQDISFICGLQETNVHRRKKREARKILGENINIWRLNNILING